MKDSLTILIIGTNDFQDYSFFEEKLYERFQYYFENDYNIILRTQDSSISEFVKKFGLENNLKVEIVPIEFKKFGNTAIFENIKGIVWGNNHPKSDLLFVFQDKWDGEKDKYICNKVIEEFKSIIDLQDFMEKKYFIFQS